jgi:hypothetical protein
MSYNQGERATLKKTQEKVYALLGKDINNLITKLGPPSNVYTMPNGNKMYTWLTVTNKTITTRYNHWLNQLQSQSVKHWCKITFKTNKSGEVVDAKINGNACRTK